MDSLWPPHSGGNGRSGLRVRVLIEKLSQAGDSQSGAGSAYGRVLPHIPILQLEDSRIAEPARGHEQLPGGSCRLGHCCLARSCLSRLLVEARPNQIVLRLFVPIPVVARSSATHSVLLEMGIGWRSALKANRTVEVSPPPSVESCASATMESWIALARTKLKTATRGSTEEVSGDRETQSAEWRQIAARRRMSNAHPRAVTRTTGKAATGGCAREAAGRL